MNYYQHFSILLIAFVASIFVFGNIHQVFDSTYAQSQGHYEDPIYPYPVLHKIEMSVQKIEKSGGGGDLLQRARRLSGRSLALGRRHDRSGHAGEPHRDSDRPRGGGPGCDAAPDGGLVGGLGSKSVFCPLCTTALIWR